MKQKTTLTIMVWALGQSGLFGSDLSVRGTVVGVDEAPLSGHITVVTSGPTAHTDSFETNGDGSYSFVVKFSEGLLVVASARGYASEEYEIESLPESQAIKIDFTLPLTGAIAGQVLDGSAKPQPGARVRIRYLDRKRRVSSGLAANTKVDDAGDFAIFPVARGRAFVVDAVADNWLPASSAVQNLDSESATGIVVRLIRRGQQVRGRVVDASLEPLSNLVVRIRVTGGEVVGNEAAFARSRLQRTKTDAEGRYEIRGLPSGNATIVAGRPGMPSIKEERELKKLGKDDATVVDFVIP